MKTFLMIAALFVLTACSTDSPEAAMKETMISAEDGVHFEHGKFADALQRAKGEQKIMMVDFYATWCGPCKSLTKQVFNTSDVGEFVNAKFVSLKVDGEKDEGPELMKKYSIPGYPTVILFDQEGNEIDRIVGYGGDKDEYMSLLKNYANGIGTLQSLLEKVAAEPGNVALNFEIAEKYNDRGDQAPARKYYQSVLNLKPENVDIAGRSAFSVAAIDLTTNQDVKGMRKFIGTVGDERYENRGYSELVRYYRDQNDNEAACGIYEEMLVKWPDNANIMNGYAWYVFKRGPESFHQRGIEVAQKAVEISPDADAIWDTLAQLNFKAGNVDAAITAIKKAIELNPEESSYKELLAEYQKTIPVS